MNKLGAHNKFIRESIRVPKRTTKVFTFTKVCSYARTSDGPDGPAM